MPRPAQTGTASQLAKTPARKKRDARRRKAQAARWQRRNGPVQTRQMTDDERSRMP